MGRLAGKAALVTGASRGIGKAIAETLGAEGAFVAIHYNSSAAQAEAVLETLRSAGGDGVTLQADLGDPQGPDALVEAYLGMAQERFGEKRLDILVNNAGVGKRNVIENTGMEELDLTLQVDFKSPFCLIKGLLPHLPRGGRIINISSMGTRVAYPNMAAYAPAKAALEALTLLLAPHLGPRGITVNAVLPGATETDLSGPMQNTEWRENTIRTIALGRLGQPRDIAGVVAFLASEEGGWVTGQCIDASGGQRI